MIILFLSLVLCADSKVSYLFHNLIIVLFLYKSFCHFSNKIADVLMLPMKLFLNKSLQLNVYQKP